MSPTRDASYVPTDEELLAAMRDRGCASLRALCSDLWPDLSWRPLHCGGDSVAEASGQGREARALLVWAGLGRLMAQGTVALAGFDLDEEDTLAAVSFEVLGVGERRDSAG